MLYTRNNDAEFTTAFNMIPWVYYYQVSSIRRKTKKQNQMTLKLHCSECCPVGFVDVVVAAGQCSHPRLKEPLCFLLFPSDYRCNLHQNYFSLFSCCHPVRLHAWARSDSALLQKVSNCCRANADKVWCLITVCSLCLKIEKKLPLYLERQHSIQL